MRQGCDAIVGCHLCEVAVDLFPRQAHGTDVAADGKAVLGSMHGLLKDVPAVCFKVKAHHGSPQWRSSRCLYPPYPMLVEELGRIAIEVVVAEAERRPLNAPCRIRLQQEPA